jgi:hypothetical protein
MCPNPYSPYTEQVASRGLFHVSTALVVPGLLIIEVSGSRSDKPRSIGLLWTSDRNVARSLPDNTHNSHKRNTSMSPAGFEPAIRASKRPQTLTLHSAATGILEENAWIIMSISPDPIPQHHTVHYALSSNRSELLSAWLNRLPTETR